MAGFLFTVAWEELDERTQKEVPRKVEYQLYAPTEALAYFALGQVFNNIGIAYNVTVIPLG